MTGPGGRLLSNSALGLLSTRVTYKTITPQTNHRCTAGVCGFCSMPFKVQGEQGLAPAWERWVELQPVPCVVLCCV